MTTNLANIKKIIDRRFDALQALLDPVEAEKIYRDMISRGIAYMCDGKHVPYEEIHADVCRIMIDEPDQASVPD